MSTPYARVKSGRERLWLSTYRDQHQALAHNPRLPPLMRLHALALGGVDNDGHCQLAPGQIEEVLGMHHANINRLIRKAMDEGVLAPGSNRRCLILPHEVIRVAPGSPDRTCDRHERTS